MMPISLTLSAFGPYPDTITIDFESFQEDGLFLITADPKAIFLSLYTATYSSVLVPAPV